MNNRLIEWLSRSKQSFNLVHYKDIIGEQP